MNLTEEKELLRRLADGDGPALDAIYRQFWQSLYLSAYAVIRDKKACEDILQDIFLQLWIRRETLQVRESLGAYLQAATRYQVFRYIRKASASEGLGLRLEERWDSYRTDDALLRNDLKRQVEEVVSVLPEKCRQIYRMSREEYLSHREISERLNISMKTVENQLTIALRRLRHSLERAFLGLVCVWWM
ncbi:MAG TPA: RNA polymerase sigma-70 factor, partial [Chitinophagaceae bacterium]|nr:RNA polymerase sigma-70 factor [Chitinophagaceae bacterium]